MIRFLKSIFFWCLKKLRIYSSYDLRRKGPLKDYGWFLSHDEKKSVDAEGHPIPWLTYPAIEFIQERINASMSVFEYGGGHSTIWWANRVKEVVVCEHDPEWSMKLKNILPDSVTIHQVNLEYDGEYSKKIIEYGKRFDIVVIDGRDRINCAKYSINGLKDDGIIIWDDTDRKAYEDGFLFLFGIGFRKIGFKGMGPGLNLKFETSIFYRQNNVFNI